MPKRYVNLSKPSLELNIGRKERVPLLHRIGFEYKKTKQVPCQADESAQTEFIATFEELQLNKEADEVHYFIDAADADLK